MPSLPRVPCSTLSVSIIILTLKYNHVISYLVFQDSSRPRAVSLSSNVPRTQCRAYMRGGQRYKSVCKTKISTPDRWVGREDTLCSALSSIPPVPSSTVLSRTVSYWPQLMSSFNCQTLSRRRRAPMWFPYTHVYVRENSSALSSLLVLPVSILCHPPSSY